MPSSINPNLSKRFKKKTRQVSSLNDYVQGIISGDRVILSRAITLIESTLPEHQDLAQQIIEKCLAHAGQSIRVGITGTPGVGKSTFIESFGQQVISLGHQLAVLAIDPSSQVSRGSILGDKTRMSVLSTHDKAFVRPSPAGRSLGGVAQKTRETIILCEAAGFDTILVETVGVGQSEIAVHSMVDFFLLLLLPGAGDELQGIKRGIVEMADLITVNKADGDRIDAAKRAKREYRNALHLFPAKENNWIPKVVTCSALSGTGMDEIWKILSDFKQQTQANGCFEQRRQAQAKNWLHETIQQQLQTLFYQHPTVKKELEHIETALLNGELSGFQGAKHLLKHYFSKK